ncbi:hypothetical protein [Prosthecobacter sp.]|uniref:hypothetical protein n=1 Tax=Prosthecobacter sp. TaxID=1965333 RepID=UPI002ABC9B28|nr:hypothetical protein [Prosthecobacter sp.]MDZ4401214.1 hypothetical protein [Prosthecobacter sp.]
MKLTPVLLLLALAPVCFLHAADPVPAKSKEPKPLRTYRDFLAVIPKDLEPENARNWSEAQKEVANGLFKKKLVDAKRPARMRFRVHGVDFWGNFVVWSHLSSDEGYSIRVFASQWQDKNMLPKLATLREGDLIEMTGVCDLAKFENLWNTPSLSLGIGNASFIKLLPNGKPAPAPERVPVKLISAVYGSGTAFTDVTDRVKALLDEPGALFQANPHWLGADPTPGWNKALIIVHEINDQRRTFTAGENGEVSAALVVK